MTRINTATIALVPSPAAREAQCRLERFLATDQNFMRAVAIAATLADPDRCEAAGFSARSSSLAAGIPLDEAGDERVEQSFDQRGAGEVLDLLTAIARARFAADDDARDRSLHVLARFLELGLALRTAIREGTRHG